MKAKDLRNFTKEELKTKEEELSQEFFNLRLQAVTGQLQNSGRMRQVRKDIARIKTIYREGRPKG